MSKKKKFEKYISASRIKTLEGCTWVYWAKYHLKLPDKTNSGAERGTLCHLIFELLLKPRHKKHFDGIIKKGSITGSSVILRLAIKHMKKFESNKVKGEMEQENYDLVDKMIVVGLECDFFGEGGHIEKPEQEFDITNDDPEYRIKGYIDKPIEYKNKKEVKIVDYKSSKAKFRGEDLKSNVQAMMYSLAAKKIWPDLKPSVEFLFLRFPRAPFQQLEFSDSILGGFKHFLGYMYDMISNFNEETAKNNFASRSRTNRWLCGKTEKGKWCCPFRKAFKFYALVDENDEIIKTSYEQDLVANKKQKVVEKIYDGCPEWKNRDTLDAFDLEDGPEKTNKNDEFDF
jgi:hypothetical protein